MSHTQINNVQIITINYGNVDTMIICDVLNEILNITVITHTPCRSKPQS